MTEAHVTNATGDQPCTGPAGPVPPPDYADQLRAAILEAEQTHAEYKAKDPGSVWDIRSGQYAMGLRVAAGLYGLREGTDPAGRARYPDCTATFMPCDPCRTRYQGLARSYVASVGDVVGPNAAAIPANVTQVRDSHNGDEWVRLTGDARYPFRDDNEPYEDADGPYDWTAVGGGGYAGDDDALIDMGPLTVQKIEGGR